MANDRIVTNTFNMPLPLAVWTIVDNYDYNDDPRVISTTTLLKPIRQIILARQNMDCLKIMDCDNLIAVSMGSALHDSVEQAWKDRSKAVTAMVALGLTQENAESIYDATSFEKRLSKEINGWIISGKYDIVSGGRVCDIKSSSVYGYITGSSDNQYMMQMSIYRWLDPVLITDDIGTNLYIFTDWSKAKTLSDPTYPKSRIQSKDHRLKSVTETQRYIEKKLFQIDKYITETDQDLIPDCTPEELWQEKDVFKYYKDPTKTARATKNYETYADALAHYDRDGAVGTITHVEGKAKACQYCSVANLCAQRVRLAASGRLA